MFVFFSKVYFFKYNLYHGTLGNEDLQHLNVGVCYIIIVIIYFLGLALISSSRANLSQPKLKYKIL